MNEQKARQIDMILDYIDRFGSITPLDAMRDLGVMRLASRITDLKRLGFPIVSKTEAVENRYGKKTYIKRYYIQEGGRHEN